MALDSAGNLYVNASQHVYKIDPFGHGSTFATKANPFQAYGIAVDMNGNVYVRGSIPISTRTFLSNRRQELSWPRG